MKGRFELVGGVKGAIELAINTALCYAFTLALDKFFFHDGNHLPMTALMLASLAFLRATPR